MQAGLVKFYAGAPLVSSAGHRLGTLCFTDSKPRKFDAESCNVLNNLAEMVGGVPALQHALERIVWTAD